MTLLSSSSSPFFSPKPNYFHYQPPPPPLYLCVCMCPPKKYIFEKFNFTQITHYLSSSTKNPNPLFRGGYFTQITQIVKASIWVLIFQSPVLALFTKKKTLLVGLISYKLPISKLQFWVLIFQSLSLLCQTQNSKNTFGGWCWGC